MTIPIANCAWRAMRTEGCALRVAAASQSSKRQKTASTAKNRKKYHVAELASVEVEGQSGAGAVKVLMTR